jgi:hypothetical protein
MKFKEERMPMRITLSSRCNITLCNKVLNGWINKKVYKKLSSSSMLIATCLGCIETHYSQNLG